jgi:hypothetical protein
MSRRRRARIASSRCTTTLSCRRRRRRLYTPLPPPRSRRSRTHQVSVYTHVMMCLLAKSPLAIKQLRQRILKQIAGGASVGSTSLSSSVSDASSNAVLALPLPTAGGVTPSSTSAGVLGVPTSPVAAVASTTTTTTTTNSTDWAAVDLALIGFGSTTTHAAASACSTGALRVGACCREHAVA